MTMPRCPRFQALLLIVVALFASSCEDNAKSNLPAPVETAPAPTKDQAAKDKVAKIQLAKGEAANSEAKESESKDAESKDAKESKAEPSPALLDPSLAKDKAPDSFKVKFVTTKGDFVIEVTRDWAPNGADRFYNLVKIGYFKDIAFFRNIAGFMVQFGIHGSPAVNAKWREANIKDDPVTQSNTPGFVTYAQTGRPHSRSTQFFVNFGDNANLDGMRFAPFGKVVEGMDVVKSLYDGYGEGAPRGRGPDQGRVQEEGNVYLKKDFPKLDYIKTATIVE
jgi:peptidyl-prolyl cis-trans isomerase A (cyclophilin A)